jgi:methionyl-tRNA formyltransferase
MKVHLFATDSSALDLVAQLGEDAEVSGVILPSNRLGAVKTIALQQACERLHYPVFVHQSRQMLATDLPEADAAVVWMYSQIINAEDITRYPLGMLNMHGGKIPEYRGASVMHWAIANGETELGITWHQIAEQVDAGPIWYETTIPITPSDTATEVRVNMIQAGIDSFCLAWKRFNSGDEPVLRPDLTNGRVWRQRRKSDSLISPDMTAKAVHNLMRTCVAPWPRARIETEDGEITIDRIVDDEEGLCHVTSDDKTLVLKPLAPENANSPFPHNVCYDINTLMETADWQDNVRWSVGLDQMYIQGNSRLIALVELIRDTTDHDLRDVIALAGVRSFIMGLPLIDMAMACTAAEELGYQYTGEAPELSWLLGQLSIDELPQRPPVPHVDEVPLLPLRRLKRMTRWASPRRVATGWLAPQATVISENDMLREEAAITNLRLNFHHAEALYRRALDYRLVGGGEDLAQQAAGLISNLLCRDVPVGEKIYRRHEQLVADNTLRVCRVAANDLLAIRQLKNLPRKVWAGTGGKWPGRVVSLEIMRRGGDVTRFDHGGGRGLARFPAWPAILDMFISTTFFLATPQLAERLQAQGVHALLPGDRQCELKGLRGEPKIRELEIARTSRTAKAKRTVVYSSGLFRGLRQTVPAQLPDVIYLDWQLRFARQLQELPIDLICRPHPEGLMANQRHPLSDVAQVSETGFEGLIPGADVFVTDQPHSTTFYEAICTDRPVVLIDFGAPYFDDRTEEMIRNRCHVIKVDYDERNRPMVDSEKLENALCHSPAVVDPGELRDLIAGRL